MSRDMPVCLCTSPRQLSEPGVNNQYCPESALSEYAQHHIFTILSVKEKLLADMRLQQHLCSNNLYLLKPNLQNPTSVIYVREHACKHNNLQLTTVERNIAK